MYVHNIADCFHVTSLEFISSVSLNFLHMLCCGLKESRQKAASSVWLITKDKHTLLIIFRSI